MAAAGAQDQPGREASQEHVRALPGVCCATRMSHGGKLSRDPGVLGGMRFTALFALLAVAAVLAACGSGSSYGGGSNKNSSTSASTSAAKSDVVASAKKAKVGDVIVDAQGRTLYRFTAEAQGVPVCTAACVGTWPPAIVANAAGLPKHVATVKRPDGGKLQLTYDGHPLYRYAGDQSKADANGEGVGGQWFVLKAGASASQSQPAKPAGKSSYGY
jgi:predicted lipoprotein with Yx(FWY)xxD motif